MLGAIGVVFGDIATSPLYALKECFNPQHGVPFSSEAVFGVISMVFWAFMVVVSIKYVMFIMRASNNGEGGILALMALALRTAPANSKRSLVIIMAGVFGACMFYGDAIITPAMSVLSATEGLQYVAPGLKHMIVPIAVGILVGLFAIQSRGTEKVGKLFGPIMIAYFLTLAGLGIMHLSVMPIVVLETINPLNALNFFMTDGFRAFIAMGRRDRIRLIIVGGEPMSDDPEVAALPPAILEGFETEPLAADARPGQDGKHGAKLKLLAGMLGVHFDELRQREAARRQRRLAIIAAASTVGFVLTTGLAIAAVIARALCHSAAPASIPAMASIASA